ATRWDGPSASRSTRAARSWWLTMWATRSGECRARRLADEVRRVRRERVHDVSRGRSFQAVRRAILPPMRRVTCIAGMFLLLAASLPAQDAKPDFSGTWNLDIAKS